MLGKYDVHPTIGVRDLGQARQFYENILGLKVANERDDEVLYTSGASYLGVYVSGGAGTNQATYASWKVDDVEAVVEDLKAKGVTFEHYENMEGVTHNGDIHEAGEWKTAWFKDPDGNYLCVSNERA